MKFLSNLFNRLSPKRDAATLYVSIDELPNPRDWGILDFAVGNKLIFSKHLDLAAHTFDAVEVLIAQHWQELQTSGYQRIVYKNVSDWVQKKIENKLASG